MEEKKVSKGDIFTKDHRNFIVTKIAGQKIFLQDNDNPEAAAVFDTTMEKLEKAGYKHMAQKPIPEKKTKTPAKEPVKPEPKPVEAKAKVSKAKAEPKPKPEPATKPKPAPKPKTTEADPRMKGRAKTEQGPKGAKPEPKKTALKFCGVELVEVTATLKTNILLGENKNGPMYPKGAEGWVVNLGGHAVFINAADYTIFEVTDKEVSITK